MSHGAVTLWLCTDGVVQRVSRAQEASAGGLPSDLAILSVAAAQLFEATADWGTEPVVDVLTCLRTVSNRTLPSAAQLPGQPKCAPAPWHTCLLCQTLHAARNVPSDEGRMVCLHASLLPSCNTQMEHYILHATSAVIAGKER